MNNKKILLAKDGGEKSVNIDFPHFNWPIISEETISKVSYVLRYGNIGEYNEEEGIIYDFEQEIKRYHNVDYALLNSSGTSSLFSAYFALGIKKGDEVLVPNYTFIATVSPLFFFGAKIKFVDCDTEQGNIDIDDLRKKISKDTKLVVVTHNWGIPVDMDPILELREEYGFKIIEDSARAIGSEYKGKKVGTIGDIGCFSFQEKKAVAGGEGGMVITNNQEYYEKMTLLGHYFKGRSDIHIKDECLKKYSDSGLGLNFGIHPLSAVIARDNFKLLDKTIENRYNSIEYFKEKLNDNKIKTLVPSFIPDYTTKLCYYHLICFYNNDIFPNISKELYVSYLRAEGVDIRITDNKPISEMNIVKDKENIDFYSNDLDIDIQGCNNSNPYYEKIIVFPPILDKNIFDQYIEAINKVNNYLLNN